MKNQIRKVILAAIIMSPLLLANCAGVKGDVMPPIIMLMPAQFVQPGETVRVTPEPESPGREGEINWTKAYGPDDVRVDPVSGETTWVVPDDLPGESFHIGVKAANNAGYAIVNLIVHVDVKGVKYVGPEETYKTIKAGLAGMESGETLIVRAGEYSGDENLIGLTLPGSYQIPPDGTAKGYTTVMAERPGAVIMTNGALIKIRALLDDVGYMAIKGFFVKNGTIGSEGYNDPVRRPHHLKFIMNGVEAGEKTPFTAFRSDDVLFENNYAFGGGRYKISSYQGSRIVFRRNVARYDRSDLNTNDPKGTYSIYTSMGVDVANNIAIDGDQPEFVSHGEIAGEYTTPTTSGPTRARFDRNIQLNSAFMYGNLDSQVGNSDAEITDLVSWDVRPYGVYVMTRASSWFNHVTMGDVHSRTAIGSFFNAWPGNKARGVTNSIMHNFQNGTYLFFGMKKENDVTAVDRQVDRYGIDTVNITLGTDPLADPWDTYRTDVESDTITSIDPRSGGLRYLLRVEADSPFVGAAKDGANMGATVMTFKGKSGTMYGEPGFDVETNIPMWPFPLEDLIKDKMAAYNYSGPVFTGTEFERVESGTGTISGERGYAVPGQSLTNYIWGYLGHTVPPFGVSATPGSGNATIKWNPPAEISRSGIRNYKVYDFDPSAKAMANPRVVAGDVLEYVVRGLDAGVERHFAVTAVDSSKGESGYSYYVSVTAR